MCFEGGWFLSSDIENIENESNLWHKRHDIHQYSGAFGDFLLFLKRLKNHISEKKWLRMISSKGGELYIQNATRWDPNCVCFMWVSQDANCKSESYCTQFTGTYSLHIITVCILFAMMLGNRIRSPMLGFLSATWPNGLFAPAASQTNRCTSNLGVVVIGDILSSMTWLLPGGGKVKPHQCMASISKSLWVGRSCFIQLLYAIMLTSCCKLCKALKHCYAQNHKTETFGFSRHQKLQLQDSRDL